jgi:sulfotransferase
MKTIHFVSSLPRSGSTLLCNILLQNPRFHATQTSGCLDVLFGIRNNWHNLVEHQANPCPNKLLEVMRSVLHTYHGDTNKPVVFDKSRGWLAYIELIENLLGRKIKILTTIRPIVDVLASFEMLYRETAKVRQPPGEAANYFQFQSVGGRCEHWMRPDQPLGLSLARLQDATRRGLQDRIHLIEFDALTSKPGQTLAKIYEFLAEEPFAHNFEHVEQVTTEDDEIHGFVNLHKIRNKVEVVPSRADQVLGKDIADFYRRVKV